MTCRDCSASVAEGKSRCAVHLARVAESTKRYREHDPEKAKLACARWARANKAKLAEYSRKRYARYKATDPERFRRYARTQRERHGDKIRVQKHARYWANPEKARLYARAQRVGITIDELKTWLARTQCEICEREFGTKECMQHLDHDHVTGKVRGVLCHRCNTMLGKLEESLDLISKFAAYLKKHSRSVAA